MWYDHLRIKSNARLFYKYNTGNSILVSLMLSVIPYAASFVLGVLFFIVSLLVASIGWYRRRVCLQLRWRFFGSE